MPKVVYVLADGTERVIDATVGDSVMLAAVENDVSGIVAECGGGCSCATCHVWVHADYRTLVGQPEVDEEDLLDIAVTERRDGSRLSCQIEMTEALDGLIVEIPPKQP